MNKFRQLLSLRSVTNILFLVFAIIYWKVVGKTAFTFGLMFRGKKFKIVSDCYMDFVSIRETFVELEYDFMYSVLNPSVILDLGANIGDTALFYSILFPNAQIFAVEPNSQVFRKLLRNTKDFPNIRCVKCAVGNETKIVNFGYSESHFGGSVIERVHNTKNESVQMYSLTEFSKLQNIENVDILKFDIEGAEELLLQDPFLDMHVKSLVGEIHDDLTTRKIYQYLNKLKLINTEKKPISKSRYIIFGNIENK